MRWGSASSLEDGQDEGAESVSVGYGVVRQHVTIVSRRRSATEPRSQGRNQGEEESGSLEQRRLDNSQSFNFKGECRKGEGRFLFECKERRGRICYFMVGSQSLGLEILVQSKRNS